MFLLLKFIFSDHHLPVIVTFLSNRSRFIVDSGVYAIALLSRYRPNGFSWFIAGHCPYPCVSKFFSPKER